MAMLEPYTVFSPRSDADAADDILFDSAYPGNCGELEYDEGWEDAELYDPTSHCFSCESELERSMFGTLVCPNCDGPLEQLPRATDVAGPLLLSQLPHHPAPPRTFAARSAPSLQFLCHHPDEFSILWISSHPRR